MPARKPRILGGGHIELRRDPDRWPGWLQDASTEHAEVEVLEDGRVVWWGGTWHDGIWVDGDWLGGTIRECIWQDGNFMAGRWMHGDWRSGYFGLALWFDGLFRGGSFNGLWLGGLWRAPVEGWHGWFEKTGRCPASGYVPIGGSHETLLADPALCSFTGIAARRSGTRLPPRG